MSPDDPTVRPGILVEHKRTTFDEDQMGRTSTLYAPKERIEDHKGEVLSCAIDPSGELAMSGGRDGYIRICRVYGQTKGGNVLVMSGHTGPILQANFSSDGSKFYTSSSDKTLANWDTYRGVRLNHLKEHTAHVNSVQSVKGGSIICSGSDDGTVRLWDMRTKSCTSMLKLGYRVFDTCFNETGHQVICAGANNNVNIWDIRKAAIVCRLRGHRAPVTGISLSPCGAFLASHSLDCTLRTWDIRPTSIPNGKNINCFPSPHSFSQRNLLRCAWSKRGHKLAAGCSYDEDVNIWDMKTRKLSCKLRVHEDSVNDIAFHPMEPIVLTASTDKYLFLSEIKH